MFTTDQSANRRSFTKRRPARHGEAKRISAAVGAVGVITILTVGFVAPSASATEKVHAAFGGDAASRAQDPMPVAPMDVVGFDPAVAEANGFRIITAADGSQSSEPVTSEARELVAAYDTSSATTFGYAEVQGNCGYSWIDITRGLSSITRIKTGYTVRLPTKSRLWSVTLFGVAGIPNYSMNSPIGGPATWSTSANVSYGSGGFGNVPPGSQVTLTDGSICVSGNPGTNF